MSTLIAINILLAIFSAVLVWRVICLTVERNQLQEQVEQMSDDLAELYLIVGK